MSGLATAVTFCTEAKVASASCSTEGAVSVSSGGGLGLSYDLSLLAILSLGVVSTSGVILRPPPAPSTSESRRK